MEQEMIDTINKNFPAPDLGSGSSGNSDEPRYRPSRNSYDLDPDAYLEENEKLKSRAESINIQLKTAAGLPPTVPKKSPFDAPSQNASPKCKTWGVKPRLDKGPFRKGVQIYFIRKYSGDSTGKCYYEAGLKFVNTSGLKRVVNVKKCEVGGEKVPGAFGLGSVNAKKPEWHIVGQFEGYRSGRLVCEFSITTE